MKRIILPVLMGITSIAMLAISSSRALADDETDETDIQIQAPLDAVDCSEMTVSVLGLTIDIQGATIVGGECADSDDGDDDGDSDGDNEGADGEDGDGDGSHQGDDEGPCPLTCAQLVTGRSVVVRLANDTTLTATKVSQQDEGDDENEGDDDGQGDGQRVEIDAPVQAIDATNQTIQVLGLTVDVSQAEFEGSDDEGDHDCGEAVDLSDLIVGQFVGVELASSVPPLVATEVRIANFSNQVEVEINDANGQPVHGVELTVHVVERVSVRRRSHRVERVFHFRTTSSSSTFTLSGLPTGRAKITVKGVADGIASKGKRRVEISPNQTQHVQLLLQKHRS